jgi:drug/metabolite transporter (DMT)-like permease
MSLAASISPLRGIVCMVLSLFFFTLSDAVSKWLTEGYPIGRIVFIRCFFMFIPIAVVMRWQGEPLTFRTTQWKMHLLRTVLFVASSFLIIISVKLLPLADAVAFLHAAPLMITALSVPLLREPVGWHRWGAVLVGFLGILIMTRPTAEAFQIAALVPIAAAAATALRDIATRIMSKTESTNIILAWSIVGLLIASAATLPFGWTTPTLFDFGLMILSGVLLGVAHYLMIESYRLAEAALVAPFKYTSIVWAVILGYLIWNDLPDTWIITGSVLIIGSGIYILQRESQKR